MHTKATSIATTLATAQETRRQWAALTDPTRRMALAADLELRRRHPGVKLPPLNPPTTAVAPEFTSSAIEAERIASPGPGPQSPVALTAAEISPETEQRLTVITETAQRAQQQIDYLASLPRYAADDHTIYLGTAWDVLARRSNCCGRRVTSGADRQQRRGLHPDSPSVVRRHRDQADHASPPQRASSRRAPRAH